ncbi:prephenate dehydrogenase [Caproicibacterium sp. BJN0003]|uniref:prephenate dehydrogenase n=1 Tax=Caproicibacterium sp. BJN0003 TaxID=2994078 RepID=UPI00225C380F|nr:prephenate dehydrogenase [Caproicibacterium sp. BJN0003]UZT82763.1 prephenate dehydrogenase [Caproicibacterium sp. BJN0003]
MKQKKRIVIVGLGLIGGSLARAFSEYTDSLVTGFDSDPAVLEEALSIGAIQKEADLADLKSADLTYLCLYPGSDIEFVKSHLHAFNPDGIVTDVCGIKTAVCAKLKELSQLGGFTYCGSHPMAGTEKHGFSASQADLFRGASYLIVPCGAPQSAVEILKETAYELGFGRAIITTPEHHDAMIAFTSQIPHALACAYVMSPYCPQHRGFSAGSYRDVSRVANINEVLWSELFLDNAGPLQTELNTLIRNLSAIRDAIAAKDQPKLESLLRQGRLVKEKLGE